MNNTTSFFNAKSGPGILPSVISPGIGTAPGVSAVHLHDAFGIDLPAMVDVGYAQIFSSTTNYNGLPMIGMTEAKGNKKTLTSNVYRWRLSGGMMQRLEVTRVICVDPRPGVNHTTFEIVLDKPWFKRPDVIQGEDNSYWLRVESDIPEERGLNEYVYKVRLVDGDPTKFFPERLIQEGRTFSKVSTAIANEDNADYGGFQFSSVFQSEGMLGQFGTEFKINDKALRKAKQCADKGLHGDESVAGLLSFFKIPFMDVDEDGKMQKWINFMMMAESKMWRRMYQDVENALMLGKASNHMESPEGHTITTGSGFREQVEGSGNVLEHNGTLTLSQLDDWFTAILKDKKDRNDSRIVLSCGFQFAKMFDRMVKEDAASFLTLDTMYIRKGKDFRHLDYGSYFASYTGFYVEVSVMINPAYDNPDFCPGRHPLYPNFTIDSWRADILDFGSTAEQMNGTKSSNISMVEEDYMNYNISHRGKWDPKTGLPITDGGQGTIGQLSGYSMHCEKSAGLMIADVSRCGAIYLNVESA